jgi:hypothetical protein
MKWTLSSLLVALCGKSNRLRSHGCQFDFLRASGQHSPLIHSSCISTNGGVGRRHLDPKLYHVNFYFDSNEVCMGHQLLNVCRCLIY